MQVTVVFNPNAGDEWQPTIGQVEALIKEAGYKARFQSTKETGWQRALKKPADLVVVAGGDGTVGSVARRLIGRGMPIAILPMGTANNIARTLGIADLPVTRLIPSWQSARRMTFDAGLARGPWGERYFIEGLGAGLLTSAIPKVDSSKTLSQLKETTVKVTYAQQVFREHLEECVALDMKVTLDGKDISGRYLLLEILNMQYLGPNLFLAPEVMRNNGTFEVVLVQEKHRDKLHDHIKNWQEGRLRPAEFITHRGKHLQIDWTGFSLHIDDKIWPGGKAKNCRPPALIDLRVQPRAVQFMVPADVHRMHRLMKKHASEADKNPPQSAPKHSKSK